MINNVLRLHINADPFYFFFCEGVWFGFVRSALILAVGMCAVLSFGAVPDLSCFLRVTPLIITSSPLIPCTISYLLIDFNQDGVLYCLVIHVYGALFC